MNQSQLDEMYLAWCAEVGIVMDSDEDRADYLARGHLFNDPGSDVHDYCSAP